MLEEVAAKMNFKIMKAKKFCFFLFFCLFWQWIETRTETVNQKVLNFIDICPQNICIKI